MIVIITLLILAIIAHFNPQLKNGEIWYNYYGRRDKTRTKFKMKKILDKILTFFSLFILAIIAIYTCGFFIFYAGRRDKDTQVITFGLILSAINLLIIYLTLKFIPI